MYFKFHSKMGLKYGNLIHLKEVRPQGFEHVTSPFGYWISRERKRKKGLGELKLGLLG